MATRLAGLAAALASVVAMATPASATSPYGRTGSADHVLRPGCHLYRYHYRVSPPTHEWTLETFLSGPAGKQLATNVLIDGQNPERGHHRFKVCRATTQYGRFTIRAKLTYYTSSGFPTPTETPHPGWLKPSHFRMLRP